MSTGEVKFFAEMAKELEASARKLETRKAELIAQLGPERVAELAALWAKTLDAHDETDMKRNMDWADKELIWVWARLERARARRVLVGHQIMAGLSPKRKTEGDGTDNE
jgi:hypothetical protein